MSGPRFRLHNLNDNHKLIYLFTYLFIYLGLLQIQAAAGAMWGWKFTNKSPLSRDIPCNPATAFIPAIVGNNENDVILSLKTNDLNIWFLGLLSIFDNEGIKQKTNRKGTIMWRVCPQLHLLSLIRSETALISGRVPVFPKEDCLWRGKKISTTLLCNLHWAEVNCFRFG